MIFKSAKQAKFLAEQHSSVFKKFVQENKKETKVKLIKKNKFTEVLAA